MIKFIINRRLGYGVAAAQQLALLRSGLPARRAAAVLVGFCALMLAGCASTLSARVTSFEQWPSNAVGATYHIAPPQNQKNSLQYQTYADMIRAAIGRTGLVEATGTDARFVVSFEYSNPQSQTWVQEYADPFMYNGFWPGYYGGGWYGSGWGGGLVFSPPVVNTPVEVYKNTLSVSINDNSTDGKQVYEATAVHVSSADNLPAAMPYLAQAIFDGFPGNNGQVREVTFELPR